MHTTHNLPTVAPPTNKEKTAVPRPPQILQTASLGGGGTGPGWLGATAEPPHDWLHDWLPPKPPNASSPRPTRAAEKYDLIKVMTSPHQGRLPGTSLAALTFPIRIFSRTTEKSKTACASYYFPSNLTSPGCIFHPESSTSSNAP